MKSFVVGGGSLLGVLSAPRDVLCAQCGISYAGDEPCFVCGRPVCRHCGRELGALGRCCARHGNLALALSREEAVETRMRAKRRRKQAGAQDDGGAGLEMLATAYYRSKDDAERALRFLAAVRDVSCVVNVEFVRELGCEGSARFDVWKAVGLIEEGDGAEGSPGRAAPWAPGTVPPQGGKGAAGLVHRGPARLS